MDAQILSCSAGSAPSPAGGRRLFSPSCGCGSESQYRRLRGRYFHGDDGALGMDEHVECNAAKEEFADCGSVSGAEHDHPHLWFVGGGEDLTAGVAPTHWLSEIVGNSFALDASRITSVSSGAAK